MARKTNKTRWFMVKNSPRKGHNLFPYSPKSLRLKIEQARYGDLPGVGSNKDTVLGDPVPEEDADATDWCSVCSPHVGGAAAAKPATGNRQPV